MNVGVAVGCSRYDDPRIADLKYAHEDANRIAALLSEVVGVHEDALVVLHDGMDEPSLRPTRANLIRELVRLSRSLTEPVDVLMFFFSGHGFHSTADGSEYLLLADSIDEVLEETSVRFELVLELVRAVKADHVVLFLDACRAAASGGKSVGAGRAPVQDLHPTGMVSFTSCEPGSLSYEADELGSGVFSSALQEALSEVGRCVTVEELSRYLRDVVPRLARRTGKPVQVPHTRIEPLELKDLELVTPGVRNSWYAHTRVGEELRRTAVHRIDLAADEDPVVAIDFGTTYSAIGVARSDGTVDYVRRADGQVLVPSVVSFTDEMDYLVGARAVEAERHRPERTVNNVKRQLGTGRLLSVGNQSLTPELVASLVIRSLRDDATAATGVTVRRAVAGCPANFSGRQKAALRQAFELAGLEVLRIVGEPNSAGMLPLSENGEEQTCLVVDLGGGTVDIALIEVGDGVVEIRSVAGNNELGGLDYDQAILGVVRARLVRGHPGLVLSDQAMVELRREAERAKRLLGTREEAVIVARDLPVDHGLEDVELVLTRDDVRAAVRHLDEEITRLIRIVLGGRQRDGSWVSVASQDIRKVVFSGSGGKMFTVREAVRAAGVTGEFFDRYQELAVVRGLGTQAGVLTGSVKEALLLDLTHRPFGCHVESAGGDRYRKTNTPENAVFTPLVDHSVTIPTLATRAMTFVGSPGEPLTLPLVEQSRAGGSVLPAGTLRIPLPGSAVTVELRVDIDADGTMCLELDDLTNRTARAYYPDERAAGGYRTEHRMRLLAEGWTLHEPRHLSPTSITDDTAPAPGETLATVDTDAELASVADQPVARGYLLTGLGRAGEALGQLVPMLAERPTYEFRVPEVCTAVCVALATLPPKYRQAGIRAVLDRLVHTTTQRTYDAKTDPGLALCVDRLTALGPAEEITRFTNHLAAMRSA
ncbi:Hsp70 family protein [Actinophytocola sp.]|uniref:Hsp70 family protein n=1 Tax=Actinophytocola sp. TaxID=1872138 RepID=UPI00389A4B1F